MIQLANDPNASRMARPAQSDGKGRSMEHPRNRGAHAWPFLSRHPGRSAPAAASRGTSSDSIS